MIKSPKKKSEGKGKIRKKGKICHRKNGGKPKMPSCVLMAEQVRSVYGGGVNVVTPTKKWKRELKLVRLRERSEARKLRVIAKRKQKQKREWDRGVALEMEAKRREVRLKKMKDRRIAAEKFRLEQKKIMRRPASTTPFSRKAATLARLSHSAKGEKRKNYTMQKHRNPSSSPARRNVREAWGAAKKAWGFARKASSPKKSAGNLTLSRKSVGAKREWEWNVVRRKGAVELVVSDSEKTRSGPKRRVKRTLLAQIDVGIEQGTRLGSPKLVRDSEIPTITGLKDRGVLQVTKAQLENMIKKTVGQVAKHTFALSPKVIKSRLRQQKSKSSSPIDPMMAKQRDFIEMTRLAQMSQDSKRKTKSKTRSTKRWREKKERAKIGSKACSKGSEPKVKDDVQQRKFEESQREVQEAEAKILAAQNTLDSILKERKECIMQRNKRGEETRAKRRAERERMCKERDAIAMERKALAEKIRRIQKETVNMEAQVSQMVPETIGDSSGSQKLGRLHSEIKKFKAGNTKAKKNLSKLRNTILEQEKEIVRIRKQFVTQNNPGFGVEGNRKAMHDSKTGIEVVKSSAAKARQSVKDQEAELKRLENEIAIAKKKNKKLDQHLEAGQKKKKKGNKFELGKMKAGRHKTLLRTLTRKIGEAGMIKAHKADEIHQHLVRLIVNRRCREVVAIEKLLVDNKALFVGDKKCKDIDTPIGAGKLTLLHSAVWFNRPKVVKALLATSASPNASNIKLNTPLHLGCEKLPGSKEVVKLLVLRNGNRYAPNSAGKNPLAKSPPDLEKWIQDLRSLTRGEKRDMKKNPKK